MTSIYTILWYCVSVAFGIWRVSDRYGMYIALPQGYCPVAVTLHPVTIPSASRYHPVCILFTSRLGLMIFPLNSRLLGERFAKKNGTEKEMSNIT